MVYSSQLRSTLQMNTASSQQMAAATNWLRESAEFELRALVEKKPEMFESVVAKQTAQLEKEINELKGNPGLEV